MKRWWLLDSLLESMGLLCLAIKNSHGSDVGRTKLQKMIYFTDRYMGWDVGDYRLHYYGPYSRNISSTLEIVRESLIEETVPDRGPYKYSVTAQGEQFLDDFAGHVCGEGQIRRAERLFGELSEWDRKRLEIAATIDYVQRGNPDLSADELLERVRTIKGNIPLKFINDTHDLLNRWKNSHGLKDSPTDGRTANPKVIQIPQG